MAPNRVPPPATRTLLPGTAQPYYPGDPVPNSPAIGVPGSVAPPPANYGPAPTTPATPPGGWNTYPQQSGPVSSTPSNNWYNNVQQVSADISLGPASGESVKVPTDNESLRFVQTPQLANPPAAPAAYESPQPSESQPQQLAGLQNPVTPTQYVQQPPVAQQRQVSIREVSGSEVGYADYDSSPTQRIGHDGFRPQGSSRSAREQTREVIRPTELTASSGPQFAPVSESPERFGFDPQYHWLRGQLQQSSTTGQWELRYVPSGVNADQFGGNVLISNPQVLGNLQPGEYVSVQGRLEMFQYDAQSMVPAYTVSVLQRQQQGLR